MAGGGAKRLGMRPLDTGATLAVIVELPVVAAQWQENPLGMYQPGADALKPYLYTVGTGCSG